MIAFGCPVSDRAKYKTIAEPGIRMATEPDSPVFLRHEAGSIQEAYNSILEEAGRLSNLEALVLIHQDVELRDGRFMEKLRATLRDPLVAVIGSVGSCNVRTLERWRHDVVGSVTVPTWQRRLVAGGDGRVDAIDGMLMVLSPWAVRTLRFDERFAPFFHGYDIDFCFQARARGRRVLVTELDVAHHARIDFFDRRTWVPAYVLFQRKWGR